MSPRTYLFVPGSRAERFDKALHSPADAIVLDLEDAVPAAQKPDARRAVGQWVRQLDPQRLGRIVIRINDVSTPWFGEDAEMLRAVGVGYAMLPKTEAPDGIAQLRENVGEQLLVLPLIETAKGVCNLGAIASSRGVARLVFGTIDFALDLGLSGDPVGFDYAASCIAITSRAYGLDSPVAGVTADIKDADLIRTELARARAHGFGAKLCIHPSQVDVVHDAMRPDPLQLEWARRVMAAAEAAGEAAIQVDGRMVDKPVLERARLLLQRAGLRARCKPPLAACEAHQALADRVRF